MVDARVVTDSGLPQHRPLALTLEVERCEQWVWKMRPPKAFPLHQGSTFSKRSADELLFFATGVLLEREGAFRAALAAWDVDGAYAILLEILEPCDIPPDEWKFYQGRGELRAPRAKFTRAKFGDFFFAMDTPQILDGLFSAGSKQIFCRKYSFSCIFSRSTRCMNFSIALS